MRLWHYKLIPYLPRQQLLGQHRECSALRGLSWGRPHSAVNYVFSHPWELLFDYHQSILSEMKLRGYKPAPAWTEFYYRGRRAAALNPDWTYRSGRGEHYPEHDIRYLRECLTLLKKRIAAAPAGRYDPGDVYRLYSLEL